jgi:nucleotide-binding universal stress UspA family protein
MKNIVALIDFSDVTFKVLKQAHTLAKALGSQVVIMHVVPEEPVVIDFGLSATVLRPASPESVAADKAKLTELQESLTQNGVPASIHQFPTATITDILSECTKLPADLIILGTHHHGAIYNLLIGSVTSEILKQATCPVLVVPA